MPTITTDTGRVNLRSGSAKVLIWHCPRQGGSGGSKETIISAAARDLNNPAVKAVSGWTNPRPSVMRLIPGQAPSPEDTTVSGSMQAATFDVANGEIIKVFASLHAPWGPSATPAEVRSHVTPAGINAQQFYRVRQGAAIVTLKVRMIQDPRCPYPFATITGPLEALTLEEAIAAGVKAPEPQYRKGYHPALSAYLITTETLQRAQTTLQTMQTEEGPREIVTAVERVRTVRRIAKIYKP